MEALDRGVVAVNEGEKGVFVSWRLLREDAPDQSFNVIRQSNNGMRVKLNDEPLAGPTSFLDKDADLSSATRYIVEAIGSTHRTLESFEVAANVTVRNYLSIPLQTPDGYHPNDASVGDLDGDGQYEIVIHMVGRGRDNSQSGVTTEPILHAYKLDGTLLWSMNLGKNIREDAHYTQFMVFDFDGDGKAEVACRSADGTIDGEGNVIGDTNADYRNLPPENRDQDRVGDRRRNSGTGEVYILKGPEFLTIFNGESGAAMATVDFVPPRHPETNSPTPQQMKTVWGDDYGNRIDRFLACVAYLDGAHPSLVITRGYYTRTVLTAWDWRDGKLQQRWEFDSDKSDDKQKWSGQGNHSIAVADVDEDGRDEIIFCAMVIDDNGTGLYSTGFGHGDAQHTSDLDPQRPGLETWSIHEKPKPDKPGVEMRDTRTGEIYFSAAHGVDVARGMTADIDPRYPGCEMWGGTRYLFDVQGNNIGPRPRSQNMAIWWDGDLLRELLNGVEITKWDYENARETRIFDGRSEGVVANNGSKANPCLSADILGDWREELIARTNDSRELRIYTTTIPTDHLVTLIHDPTYRLSVAWQNVGYNQPPHPGLFQGHPMQPKSHITVDKN